MTISFSGDDHSLDLVDLSDVLFLFLNSLHLAPRVALKKKKDMTSCSPINCSIFGLCLQAEDISVAFWKHPVNFLCVLKEIK